MDPASGEREADGRPREDRDAAMAELLAERDEAQTLLRESRAKVQAIFEGVETGILVIDPETHRIVDANPVALALTGGSRDKMVGALCHKFVCPAEVGRCPVTDLGQTVDNSERVLLTIDGEKRSIIKTVKPVEMGGRPYLLESFLDITERKHQEEALEERTAYLNTLIEASPLGIVVLDKEERVQLSNAALERLFLYSAEEMLGKRLGDLLVPEELTGEADHFTQECLSGRSVHFTSRRKRKDNAPVEVEVFGVPLAIAGRREGVLALYQDVTARTRIEAEMAEHHRWAALAAEVGLALTGAEDLHQGLQQCAEALVRHTDIVFVRIWTRNENGSALEMRASADIQLTGGQDRMRMDMARIEGIAASGVAALDNGGEAGFGNEAGNEAGAGEEGPRQGMASFVGYPLKVRDQVRGVAAAFTRQAFTDAAVQAFEWVVNSIAQFVESKRAEASLRESEDRFRTAFEEAPHGMCMTGPDGRFLNANAALCRMLGYTSEELLAGAWQEVTHGDDLALSRDTALRFRQGLATTLEIEKRYIHKQGNAIWARVIISVVKDGSGSPSHYVTQIEDITKRKRADEAQAFLASLVESSQDAIIGTTPAGVIVSWNRGAAEQYGYSAEEMIGRTPVVLAPPERESEVTSILARARERETVSNHETVRIRKDGGRVDVSLNISPVFDGDGKVAGVVNTARDITQRKKAEQALLSSEGRYRELFENASDPVYTFDLDMRITSLNRMAEEMAGYTREEAVGTNLQQLVDVEKWKHVEEAMGQMVGGGAPAKFDTEIRSRDGRRVTVEINPRLIYRDGEAVGMQAIMRDITGRDVAEMELRQAQKLESVGRLASGIAHEINTPMQFVGDNVRFLQDSFGQLQAVISKLHGFCDPALNQCSAPELYAEIGRLDADLDSGYLLKEIPEALSQTLDGVERVVTIVRAMKEFAHPESRGAVPADLNKALMNTLTVARNELKYVAEVETDFGDLPPVICSLSDVNQVFLNLLVNAAHAIGDVVGDTGSKGTIRLKTRREGSMAVISIADTGAGIPAGIRERIFDPFFTTKQVGRGTGQGLAIARSVVDRHKGTLTFESEVSKGTTFYVRLPIEGCERRGQL
jgi:two-component system NtrC family sensor kinase